MKSAGNAVIPTFPTRWSHGLQGSLKRRYKHPSPTSINGYHTAKKLLSQSPAKRLTFAFADESGYTLAFANRIAHSGLHAETGSVSDGVLRQIEDYMDYVRKQPLFNSQYRRWKFIAVCSAVDDDVKARYDSQKSKGKKGLVAEIDNYEVYALTWDDVFQSFDLRHAFLLDKLKMDKEAIAAEIAQTAGDEKSKDTADALTALVAN